MANTPKLIKIPGPFLKAVERLLHTAPPPKTAKDRKILDDGLKSLERVRSRKGVKKRATAKRQGR